MNIYCNVNFNAIDIDKSCTIVLIMSINCTLINLSLMINDSLMSVPT